MEYLDNVINFITIISIDIPIYLILSPICIVSSQYYKNALGFGINDQTIVLIISLIAIWTSTAILIYTLIKIRKSKQIYFYQFFLSTTVVSFTLMGVTYLILKRNNLEEQTLAKVLMTLTIIYFSQKFKSKNIGRYGETCNICLLGICENNCIIL